MEIKHDRSIISSHGPNGCPAFLLGKGRCPICVEWKRFHPHLIRVWLGFTTRRNPRRNDREEPPLFGHSESYLKMDEPYPFRPSGLHNTLCRIQSSYGTRQCLAVVPEDPPRVLAQFLPVPPQAGSVLRFYSFMSPHFAPRYCASSKIENPLKSEFAK